MLPDLTKSQWYWAGGVLGVFVVLVIALILWKVPGPKKIMAEKQAEMERKAD